MSSQGNYPPPNWKEIGRSVKYSKKVGCVLIGLLQLFVIAVFIVVIIKSK